jgi:hypothetical protein
MAIDQGDGNAVAVSMVFGRIEKRNGRDSAFGIMPVGCYGTSPQGWQFRNTEVPLDLRFTLSDQKRRCFARPSRVKATGLRHHHACKPVSFNMPRRLAS